KFANRFWGSLNAKQAREAVHMPITQDITSTSASLLFGEPVDIETDVMRLEEILEEKDIDSYLLEAADLCAGMGGVFLKIDVDRELSSMPILTSKSPSDTIAHFKYGFLQEVEFLKEVSRDAYLVEKRSMNGEKDRKSTRLNSSHVSISYA